MVLKQAALLVLCAVLVSARPDTKNKAQCGYEGCPQVKPGMINIHLVPHTHDDVGWLKTVDQYFYGHRNSIQKAGVQYVLDGIIQDLIRDPNKRFAWVETAFLMQWWNEQDEPLREQVRALVNAGQLEITGGAWSMHDEAVTHYQSIVDQFTWGFRNLDEMFGSCARPVIGWQIDPFGHARESASLMAQMGFDGLFFARLDYQDKQHRLDTNTMELIWQASANLGDSSWMFTHALYNHYSPPPGFCFDILCDDEPFIDNPRSPDYNVNKRVEDYIKFAEEQAAHYNSENIINLMGEDFHYQSSRQWYKNLDKLIKYVNAEQENGGKVNIFYSSPSCYVKAVNEANLTWTSKQDDFFPYPNDQFSYWTGYYTSRPTLKYFERRGNNLLQSVKQLHSMAWQTPEQSWTDISSLREMMGVMQHHDAITGTEKQHVAEDYALRFHQTFQEAQQTASNALNKLMAKSDQSPTLDMQRCLLLNISQCAATEESSTFVLTVYNPLARVNSMYVRVPVAQAGYQVLDSAGVAVTVQIVPIPETVINIPGREGLATQELVFKAADIPALGFKNYFVEKLSGDFVVPEAMKNKFSIGSEKIRAKVSEVTGLLESVTLRDINIPFQQNMLYYIGNRGAPRSSGAYVFKPADNILTPLIATNLSTVVEGPIVEEIHQEFGDWASQVIRIYKDENYVEFEWQVGPIPIDDDEGKEIITRYSTGWATNELFYTDSNGRETLERKRNYRPTWEVEISEPVSSNYYPITTHIGIKGNNKQLSVLVDRAQGGSSLQDGDIELMLHRRLLSDDGYGVSEPLNETAYGEGLVARGRHIILLGDSTASPSVTAQQRQLTLSHMNIDPLLFITPTSLTLQEWQQNFNMEYSGLRVALPANVHLMTLEPWGDHQLLLRLEHFFEANDDPVLSLPAQVELEEMFEEFTITSIQEMTLGGNQKIEESERLSWRVTGDVVSATKHHEPLSNKLSIPLQPMQIRTFVVQVTPRKAGVSSSFWRYFNIFD